MLAISRDRHTSLKAELKLVVRNAGQLAESYFRSGERTAARIWSKHGGSPVTEADLSVDEFLKSELTRLLPECGWLSEETVDDLARTGKRDVWVVDPIDGTRAFMNGDPNWSVSVALVSEGRPTLGIVFAPALDQFYEAAAATGAARNGVGLKVSGIERLSGARVAGPKPLVDRLERQSGPVVLRLPKVPSLALRLARVAAGDIDAGLVSETARDWDIAAADLIVAEAGGRLTTLAGEPPLYNQREPAHGVLVSAGPVLHDEMLRALSASAN
jgi:myo-inositol-1(or 4)-monophosphatase